jgi:dynein heavy chain 2
MIESTTKVGIVNNCLGYLNNCQSKGQFAHGCILGLGSNFKYDLRIELGNLVLQISGEKVADPKNLLSNYFDIQKQSWSTFVQQAPGTLNINDIKNPEAPPLFLTTTIQRDVALVKPLLESDQSFILVGPEGCGKNLVIRSLIKQMKSTQMAVIHCNA